VKHRIKTQNAPGEGPPLPSTFHGLARASADVWSRRWKLGLRRLGTISFRGITPVEGPLPPFFRIWERGKREVQRDLDSFRERREIECERESLSNGMDILGDSCVRLNLP